MIILIIIFLILILIIYYSLNRKLDIYNYKNNLLIIKNFYDKSKFNKIKKLLSKIKLKKDNRVSTRKTLCLKNDIHKELYDLIYNDNKLKKIINKIYNKKYINNPDFPIEYRKYPNKSSGMHWHKDLSMFSPDCLEVVLTIENNSNSNFLWDENGKIKNIKPSENTLVIVKPNTVSHKVSEVDGYRTILKYIIQFKNSIKKESFYKQIKNCPI